MASTVFAGLLITPGAASAAVAPAVDPTAVSACDNPPDSPDATVENRDRYVKLWSARFADKAWLKSYTALETVPDDIRAEGFHAMDGKTQLWLNSCLLDDMLATAHETPTAEKRSEYLLGLNMVIFGKAGIKKMREELAAQSPAKPSPLPVHQDLTSGALKDMATDLTNEPSLVASDQPRADATTPSTSTSQNLTSQTSPHLQELLSKPAIQPQASAPQAAPAPAAQPTPLVQSPITSLPLVPQVLQAVNEVLQLVSKIQAQLFTLPGVNLLATAFYKICAESPTMPLACSVSLPVGVPIPADVTGDNLPDVAGTLFPMVNLLQGDVGARFVVQRLAPNAGPLPAHVFAVYDTPFVKKRIEVGYDGRSSTLAKNTTATFTLKHALSATTGDIEVAADLASNNPGSTEALTFAIKTLVGGSIGVLPSEEDPMGGSVQMSPFPENFNLGAHLVHTGSRDQDTITVKSTVASRVDAIIDQRTTTTATKSNQRITATVDKLPTSVTLDLLHQGKDKQSIDYRANAPIGLVQAGITAIPDTSKPDQTKNVFELKDTPTWAHVDLTGTEDIEYRADGHIGEVGFATETVDGSGPVSRLSATAKHFPTWVHVTDSIANGKTAVTYDADDKVASVEVGMFSRGKELKDRTDIKATATSIPKHVGLTLDDAGIFDVAADEGVGLITAQASRGGGALYGPIPSGDHITVLKRGDEIGAEAQLTGFQSAHFDGTKDTTVSLGLDPGGQSFQAIGDLKDPNGMDVLATAEIAALPSTIGVTLSPAEGTATYTASSVIPQLKAAFTARDTQQSASVTLTDLPKTIGLTFNTSGKVPQITYDADSRLGSIDATYVEKPGAMALHALVSNLPQYLKIGGMDPMVFDARTGKDDPSGSSDLGQILFQYATDGTFQSPPTTDDHVFLNNTATDTHAEVQYSGLSYLSLDTSNQELHAEIRNTQPRLLRAYLTTPTLSATGFIDKVPAVIKLGQVGNLVSYDASSPIAEIYTDLHRSNGDAVTVDIADVPKKVDVTFDGAGSTLDWHASGATGSVSALAHLTPDTLGGTRAFDAGLTITSIPDQWNAGWANGNVLFEAPGAGIGAIEASVTNHGGYHLLGGDHLSAYYDEASGDLDASLKISNLHDASFTKLAGANGGGFEAGLNMGDQGAFALGAEVKVAEGTLKASGGFDHLPSVVTLKSDGGRITYDGNSNPDLTLSVAAGKEAALAATPVPAYVHGVAVRDGASGTDKAVRAKVYLTGLPSHLDLNTPEGTYTVNGYHPSIATLVVDAKLSAIVPKPLSLQVQQVVPTASPVDFTFGPFLTTTAGDGTHNLSIDYHTSQTLGSLTAEATYDNTDDAKLMISSIPSSIHVDAGFGAAQKTIGVAMAHGISDITAAYKKVGAADFAASVHLHDVPSAVNVQIGRATSSSGGTDVTAPDFTMTASQPGLDIDATASAAITDPADITAAVTLQIADLGQTVTGQLEGTSLHITSAPATGSFLLQAAGTASKSVDLGFGGGGFTNTGSLTANVALKKLTLGFDNAADLRLDLGITTGLRGDFSSFTFGQQSDIQVHIDDDLDFFIDWPDPFGTSTIDLFSINANVDLGNVVPQWRINSNTFGTIFSVPVFEYLIGECSVDFKARPAPGFTTASSTFTLGPPPNDGDHTPAWLMTPDLNLLGISLPDFGLDLIAFFASPYGHGFKVTAGCHEF